MALHDIEKDLQQRDSQLKHRQRKATPYDVWTDSVDVAREEIVPSTWQKITDQLGLTRAKALLIGVIGLAVVTAIMVAVVSIVRYQQGFFHNDRVSITIEAPASAASTALTEIVFTVRNDNRAALTDADIAVQLGSYFIPLDEQSGFYREGTSGGIITVGTIAGGATHTVSLAGYFNGPRGIVADISGVVRFVPDGTTVRYEAVARSATMITQSPLTIDVNAPNDVASENLVDIGFVVRNTSTEDMHDLSLTINIPQGFSVVNTVPAPNHGFVWVLDRVPARGEVTVRLRGTVSGDVGVARMFRSLVHSSKDQSVIFAQTDYTPRIIRSPLALTQAVDGREGIAYAGEYLTYQITYHNIGDTPLRDAIVRIHLDERVLDLSQLKLIHGGDYHPNDNSITWKASDVPGLKLLAPNDRGEVVFSVPVVAQLPVEGEKDFHYAVSTVASIDSPDIPSAIRENKTILSNTLTVPIGAKILPSATLAYKEGSMPLRVGEKTVYDLTFSIGSVNNDLANVQMVIPLPTHMTFHESSGNGVLFNERTNEIVWNVGTVLHGSGVVSPSPQMTVTLSLVPSIDQRGSIPPAIVNAYTITGVDTFINKPFSLHQTSIDAFAAQQGYGMGVVAE